MAEGTLQDQKGGTPRCIQCSHRASRSDGQLASLHIVKSGTNQLNAMSKNSAIYFPHVRDNDALLQDIVKWTTLIFCLT